ncbi:MAG: imidazole glycerol phosphate synthase subunit HisH [Blautia sp.]|nr:imidazole glycerol phosphate synthase subunit HisH [Blautia sp.]
MIAIIDYDAGNIRSVEKALLFQKEEAVVTRDAKVILSADGIILPGVGNFGDAMGNLVRFGLVPVISEAVEKKIPFLGICVGLQLLFEGSEESPGVKGLSLLPGVIRRIPAVEGLKIPHMGWNSLSFPFKGRLFDGIGEEPYVYFVHSYYLDAADKSMVCATTEYGVTIDASVEKGLLFATQFHPEKSSAVGQKLLMNFAKLTREKA